MSELSYVEITKTSKINIEVRINSFRDDALPNPSLKDSEKIKIATTGFVMFANFIGEEGGKFNEKEKVYNKLQEIGEKITLSKFKQTTVDYFIKDAEVTSFFNIDDTLWADDFPFELNPEERESLYKLQIQYYKSDDDYEEDLAEFLEEYPTAESDFSMNMLYFDQNKVTKIVGSKKYKQIQAHVTIKLTFNDASYIENLAETKTYGFGTSLDSYLYDWL